MKEFRKQVFHRDYMPRIVSFAKSRDLFARVKQNGTKIVLATSSDKEDVATYKRIIGIEDLVDEEATASDAQESKPEPDIFAVALKKIGAPADRAVALGDTPYDAQAAGKLGIRVIGLTCGGWKRDDLRDAGCIEIYQDPADLLLHFDVSLLGKK
jgi:HAD superfamily hydrolase (TIGR01509 family)